MNPENDTPADVGTVVEIKGGNATIEFSKSEACTTCKIKPFCFQKSGDITRLTLKNELDAKLGDRIQFEILPSARILSSFLVFILPVIFMITTYFLCKSAIGLSENLSILCSVGSIVLAFLVVKLVDGAIKKRVMIQPRMLRIIHIDQEAHEKEKI